MECADVKDLLLPRETGGLSEDEATELDGHAASCPSCRSLVEAAGRTYRLLEAWRVATDSRIDDDRLDELVAGLAAEREARSEARRLARPADAGGGRAKPVVMVVGLVAALVAVVAITVMPKRPGGPVGPDPMPSLVWEITDVPSARDAACVLDVMLLRELSFDAPRARRFAELSWARALARREGFAPAAEFAREIVQGRAEEGSEPPPTPKGEGGSYREDPLRLAAELELAGRASWAEAELRRVLASEAAGAGGPDGAKLRRRARLHLASVLLMQGKLDHAQAMVDGLAPPPVSVDASPENGPSAEEGAAGAEGQGPRDFVGRLAEVLRHEIAGAREARAALEGWQRPRPGDADDKGGARAIDAFDFAGAFALLKGSDPTYHCRLVAGWARLLRGEIDEAHAALSDTWKNGPVRYMRSLAFLGLSEIAFREGRYPTGLGRLGSACVEAPFPESPTRYVTAMMLARGTRRLLDVGCAPDAEGDLHAESLPLLAEDVERLVDSTLRPRIAPLVEARDAVTKTWPRKVSAFERHGHVQRAPGTVTAREALPKIDFEPETPALAAAHGSYVSPAEGVSGGGAKVFSTDPVASAELPLEGVPEVETWVACAVKLQAEGEFTLTATDAADGRVFRWRTFVLRPGRWSRLAVPLGAFEPEKPTGRDESLLTRKVSSVGFSLRLIGAEGATGRAPAGAAFVLDDVLIHHGRVPKGTDERVE